MSLRPPALLFHAALGAHNPRSRAVVLAVCCVASTAVALVYVLSSSTQHRCPPYIFSSLIRSVFVISIGNAVPDVSVFLYHRCTISCNHPHTVAIRASPSLSRKASSLTVRRSAPSPFSSSSFSLDNCHLTVACIIPLIRLS